MKDYKLPKKVKVKLSGFFEDRRGKIFNSRCHQYTHDGIQCNP